MVRAMDFQSGSRWFESESGHKIKHRLLEYVHTTVPYSMRTHFSRIGWDSFGNCLSKGTIYRDEIPIFPLNDFIEKINA